MRGKRSSHVWKYDILEEAVSNEPLQQRILEDLCKVRTKQLLMYADNVVCSFQLKIISNIRCNAIV